MINFDVLHRFGGILFTAEIEATEGDSYSFKLGLAIEWANKNRRSWWGGANLSGANLRRADLSGADLSGADLRSANLSDTRLPDFFLCPEEGSFIAFKKLCDGLIAKLEIPADAKRTSSLVGRKCRAEYAKVLSITNTDGKEVLSGRSQHDENYIYKVGESIRPNKFDPDPRVECTNGIHFFITRKEAENY